MTSVTLDELPVGRRARVAQLGGQGSFRRRLLELGLLPGTFLTLVRRAAVGGVLEVEVRKSHLSLRLSEARAIRVLPAPEG